MVVATKLTREGKIELLKTVKKCVSKTKVYASGNKYDKVRVLIVNALAILHNMSLLGFDDESKLVAYEYVNVYKNVKNKYILNELEKSYDDFKVSTHMVSKVLRVAFSDYADIAETLLTNEEDTVLNAKHPCASRTDIYRKLFVDIMFATNKKFTDKKFDEFMKNPKKTITQAGSSLRSVSLYMILQNLNCVQNFREEFISSKDKEFSVVYQDKCMQTSKISSADKFETALINMRFYINKFNGVINEILINNTDNDNVFEHVMDSVADSIRTCQEKNITTVVQCMNLVLNNLIVASVELSNEQNEIKLYAKRNYKNRHYALLNVSGTDAIRKAHNVINHCSNDVFNTTLPYIEVM